MRVIILALLLAGTAQAQQLRYPYDAIVLQEIYRKCEIKAFLWIASPKLYPEIHRTLSRIPQPVILGNVASIRKSISDRYPKTVSVRIQMGECGERL